MPLTTAVERDLISMRQAIARLSSIKLGPTSSPKFLAGTITANLSVGGDLTVGGDIDITGTLTLSELTASRLIATNASKELVSSDLNSWIAGTANEIDITDDGDGTVTIGIVNPLIVGKGGSGAATFTDHSILVGSGTAAFTAIGAATNGQIPIGSTGNDPALAGITGTANQITVTDGAGSITLSLPQDYDTGATPTLADLTLSAPSNIYSLSHDSFTDFVANEHIDHTSVTLTAGKGLSGGGDISANRSFALDLTEMTGNVTWDDGSTDVSITWTYALSGANDPVWTIGSNSMDLTTGALKQGGTQVMLVGDAPTAHTHDGDTLQLDGVNSDGGAFAFTTSDAVTFSQDVILNGTENIGIDLSGGTWANADINLTADPVIQMGGTNFLRLVSATYVVTLGEDALGGLPGGITQAQNDGKENVCIGYRAGYNNDHSGGGNDGTGNVYIGQQAGEGDAGGSTGIENFGLGGYALNSISTGDYNVAIGRTALENLTTGLYNIAIGTEAGRAIVGAQNNTLIGGRAGADLTNNNNMAIGGYALYKQTTGTGTVALGNETIYHNITGSRNTAVGWGALRGATGQNHSDNVAVGNQAGYVITTGGSNVFVGKNAGHDVTSGQKNVMVGQSAGGADTTNSSNTYIGTDSGRYVTGSRNTVLGYEGGKGVDGSSTFSDNVFIGYQAGYNQTVATDILIIDNQDRSSIANEITNSLVYGVFDATPANQSLRINGEILGSDGAKIGDVSTNNTVFATDGLQTMTGTARVTKYAWLPTGSVRAQAGPGTGATETTNSNNYLIISFADNVDRWAQANIKIPDDMDLSADSYICFGWSSPTTSANAIWDIKHLITAPNDSTDQAGTTTSGVSTTSSATADGLVVSPVVTISGGTIQSDEVCIHIQLMRDGNNGSDTLGDVAEMHGMAFQYVSNKLGIAT